MHAKWSNHRWHWQNENLNKQALSQEKNGLISLGGQMEKGGNINVQDLQVLKKKGDDNQDDDSGFLPS